MSSTLRLLAPAKVTLSLRVTGVRDDGYHLIDAEMVLVDLYDELEVDPDGDGLTVVDASGRESPGAVDDLVARALSLAGRTAGVRLHKHIPAGAGLGGGSSDAAAVLRWAGVDNLDVAAQLGADVPFCVAGATGTGRARVGGIGEVVEPLAFQSRTLTLLTPQLHCSTPVVYRTWDELGGPVGEHGNDLEPAALAAFPELARWRDLLGDATGQQPRLAGSGSTWFVEGGHTVGSTGVRVVHTLSSVDG
jgi:4-diphosphocytidyl-2-C-methyl-D-erythritol kinase